MGALRETLGILRYLDAYDTVGNAVSIIDTKIASPGSIVDVSFMGSQMPDAQDIRRAVFQTHPEATDYSIMAITDKSDGRVFKHRLEEIRKTESAKRLGEFATPSVVLSMLGAISKNEF